MKIVRVLYSMLIMLFRALDGLARPFKALILKSIGG